MSLTKLQQAFITALRVSPECDFESLSRGTTPEWESVAHMELVVELEQAFGVALSADDVFGLEDFRTARAILSRHGINVGA
jgi:acyl carrier protein